jgi:regulator of sigma E protease
MMLPILAQTSLYHLGMILLLILGFGFVIFWHELGHFLAAKAVGIKVEQFAVGFGQALVSWRKGVGVRWGNTQKEYYKQVEDHLAHSRKGQLAGGGKIDWTDREMSHAASELGLGDTEYRLNWIPLGGYVKMLGQDDLRPDAAADDPRAYNRKSVSARMLVISAGVIMNVILAAILFVGVFLIGLNASPAWVGNIIPQSPAQKAGLMVGDRIRVFDGHSEEDFTKIKLDTALAKADATVSITVARPQPDKSMKEMTFTITPERPEGGTGFVSLGFEQPIALKGLTHEDVEASGSNLAKIEKDLPAESLLVLPGDTITAINGKSVSPDDFQAFDAALQDFGKPVQLSVRTADGHTRSGSFQPHFMGFFSGPFHVAGMCPRAEVAQVTDDSSARGKLQDGDDLVQLTVQSNPPQTLNDPTRDKLMELLKKAGASGDTLSITVLRHEGNTDKTITFSGLKATASVGDQKGQKGLGVGLDVDETHPVVGDVLANSPAAAAGLVRSDAITAINDQPVKTWYDVHRLLAGATAGQDVRIAFTRGGHAQQATLKLDAAQLATVQRIRYSQPLPFLAPYTIDRKATNAWVAVKWGVIETRDFILQFYVTLQRMFGGSIALSNMMGPVGIFIGGKTFAYRGISWLLWFLAMISANLAVVNFLPIPVVDGGQFVFLILEKIKGRPLSPRAMAIAQYVGLAFLAAVVVFVTYHDIMRRY